MHSKSVQESSHVRQCQCMFYAERMIIIDDTCSLACFHTTGTHPAGGSQSSDGACGFLPYHAAMVFKHLVLQLQSLKPARLACTVEMCLVVRQMLCAFRYLFLTHAEEQVRSCWLSFSE